MKIPPTPVLLLALSLGATGLAGQAKPGSTANFATLAAKADAARDADHLDEAAALYRKALVLRPNWAEGWWSLGTIEYDKNSYLQATRAFQKAASLAPRNGNAYVMLGLSEFELGRDHLALEHLEKGTSLGLDKNSNLWQVALYHQGVLRQRLGQFESAQETLEPLCLQELQSDAVESTLGMVLLRSRSKNPPSPSTPDAEIVASIGRAGCLARQKKFDESKNLMTDLVGRNPEYPGIHYAFGALLLEASELPAAVSEFKEEIRRRPEDVVSRLQIAAALYKMDSAGGLPYAQEAVRLAPQQPFAHMLLGLLLLDTGDSQVAIPELEIARKAFPREVKIYLVLATAYSRVGRKKDAVQARATFARLNAESAKSNAAQGPGEPAAEGAERIRMRDMPSPPQ